MVFALAQFPVAAATGTYNSFKYSMENNEVTITGYTGTETAVTVPATINGFPVIAIGEYAFNWCISLESIDLGNGVKTIGNGAFMGCTALKEITIPATVTKIDYSPFSGCTALESIHVKEGNTNFVSIDGVLYGLSGGGVVCKLIKVPANKQITTFEILDSLWSVEVDAFEDNKHIQSIVASENSFDYFTIDGVLFGKNSGTLIRYPVGKTDTEYTVPDGVQEIYISAFRGCTELESVIIPDSVTTIWGSAFYGCSSLKEVTLGEGVTHIYDSAFYDCSSIIDVYYNGTEIQRSEITIEDYNDGLTDATWHYADEVVCEHSYDNDCDEECNNCGEIREITHIYTDDCDADCNECNATRKAPHTYDNNRDAVCNECGHERNLGNPASDFEYYVSNDEVTITGYIGTETDVIVPEVIEDCPVTTIGLGAFSRTAVTSVVFPDSVKAVNESVFDSCLSLKEVDLGDGIRKIGLNLFKNCVSLETITIPASAANVDPSAFEGCSALTEINVEQGNTEYVSINGVLYSLYDGEVNNLEKYPAGKKETSFEIPSYIWGVDTNAFNGNKYLQAITVEEGNIFLRAQDGVLFDAFSNDLIRYPEGKPGTTYAIPDDTTAIYFSAFEGCDKLVSVTIPESVTKIWNNAFRNCTSLESIAIPEGVQQISGSAFSGCLALSSVTIPKSVTQISSFAFDGCSALTDVYYEGTEEDKASVTIDSYNTPLTNATWHYKSESDFEYTVEDGEAVITGYSGTASELIIPDEIDSYPVVGIADYAFYNNTTLTAVYFPNTLRYIGEYAFYGCTSLLGDLGQTIWSVRSEVSTILTIPDSVTYIGAYAFGGCDSLAEVALGSSVESIGDGAFSNCTALETINIPTSVTTIGNGVFTGCDSLAEVRYEGSADDKENITFGDGNDNLFDIWQDTVDRLPGDVNADGFVNNKDFGILRQFLNNWDVVINESNADVNADGFVNNKDMGILRQYLNNWDVVLK